MTVLPFSSSRPELLIVTDPVGAIWLTAEATLTVAPAGVRELLATASGVGLATVLAKVTVNGPVVSAPAMFVALEDSALGAAIRESTWIYMTANVGHVLSLMAFAGAIAVMDLRMMGVFAATSPGYIMRMARWAAAAAAWSISRTMTRPLSAAAINAAAETEGFQRTAACSSSRAMKVSMVTIAPKLLRT